MTTTEPVQDQAGFHSLFFEHLASYSLVDYAYKTAQGYYTRVKEANRVLKYGFETAESLTKAALPLVKTAEPLLSRADTFSLRQLERVEAALEKPYQKVRQLPYALLDKTLDIGEGTLDYWLPVEDEAGKKATSKEDVKKSEEQTLKQLQTRAFLILDAFQLRAKDKIYSVPAVSKSVNYVSAKAQDAKALGKRAYGFPGAVRLYYKQRKDEVVSKVTALYLRLRQTVNTTTERVFDFVHNARLRLDALRSSTVQDLAVGLINRLHELGQVLYDRLFPTKLAEESKERISKVVTQLNEYNPLHKKKGEKEAQVQPAAAPVKVEETAVPREEQKTNPKKGRSGRKTKGKQINDEAGGN